MAVKVTEESHPFIATMHDDLAYEINRSTRNWNLILGKKQPAVVYTVSDFFSTFNIQKGKKFWTSQEAYARPQNEVRYATNSNQSILDAQVPKGEYTYSVKAPNVKGEQVILDVTVDADSDVVFDDKEWEVTIDTSKLLSGAVILFSQRFLPDTGTRRLISTIAGTLLSNLKTWDISVGFRYQFNNVPEETNFLNMSFMFRIAGRPAAFSYTPLMPSLETQLELAAEDIPEDELTTPP